jgi:hypothetical protein
LISQSRGLGDVYKRQGLDSRRVMTPYIVWNSLHPLR